MHLLCLYHTCIFPFPQATLRCLPLYDFIVWDPEHEKHYR